MGNLVDLETLVLAMPLLGTLPATFSKLLKLQEIELGVDGWCLLGNYMPPTWNTLPDLRSFTLVGCLLDGFSTQSTCNWPKLEHLNLTNSASANFDLVSILNGSPKLEALILTGCTLITGQLLDSSPAWPEKIKIVDLDTSAIFGSIPSSFWKLKHLEQVSITSARSLTIELGNGMLEMHNLQRLELLDAEQLFGSIPLEIGKYTNMTSLQLSSAVSLRGNIPPSIVELKNLRILSIDGTSVQGTIPERISGLSQLTMLNLSSNHLSGTIPQQIGSLKSLTKLLLAANNLVGTIPETLGSISSLEHLSLSWNQLEGTLPESLASNTELAIIQARSNRISGTIPNLQSEKILILDLAINKLQGTVPPTAAQFAIEILLDHNQLGGIGYPLPSPIFEANQRVRMIDISNNLFIDTPLPYLPRPHDPYTANFKSNGFTGSIPSDSYCHAQATIILSDNHLSGTLDDILTRECTFPALDISKNYFNGTLPDELSHMNWLVALDISDNNLTGTLPPVRRLGAFFASNNRFSGKLSEEFIRSIVNNNMVD